MESQSPLHDDEQRNGKKLRVLILNDNIEMNHLLESRFPANKYRVTIVERLGEIDKELLRAHDIFLLGAQFHENFYNTVGGSDEKNILMDLMAMKRRKGKPYLAMIPVDIHRFDFYGGESLAGSPRFEESVRIIKGVYGTYQRLKAKEQIDLTPDLVASIDDLVNEPRDAQRVPLEVLRKQITENPENVELRLALGREYEARNQPLDAIQAYETAWRHAPNENERIANAIGKIVLNRQVNRHLDSDELTQLLRLFTTTKPSVDVDHYKNATYLALGDEHSLRSAIEVCKRHETTPAFGTFYPALIDAYSKLAILTQRQEDIEQLSNAIERFVEEIRDMEYSADVEGMVGIRLVKKHAGRHTVYNIVPTTRHGTFLSQHVFVKAFTLEEQKSAQIETANIHTLNNRYHGKIRTKYAELEIPSFAVLAKPLKNVPCPSYLVTPLLDGERADRFLEKIAVTDIKHKYLRRIMDCGIALQLAMKRAKRVIEPEPDFYLKRFEKKIIMRMPIMRASLKKAEREEALDFIQRELNEPLMGVATQLRLPYTGSHTLKNILIAPSQVPGLSLEEEAQRSTIGRCDLEDASNRFFASDHVLSIEDSAIGLTEPRALAAEYDRLLLRLLTTRKLVDAATRAAVDGNPVNRARIITQLLRKQHIPYSYKQYHDLVARTSLERHLTFAFDRVKEIAIKKAQISKSESPVLNRWAKYLHTIRSLSEQSTFNYDEALEMMRSRRHAYRDDAWKEFFAYLSLHRDYDAVKRSKDYHVSRVQARMNQLWGKTNDTGYRVFKKIIEAAAAFK